MMRFVKAAFLALTATLAMASGSSAATITSTGLGPIGSVEPNWTVSRPYQAYIVTGAADYPGAWYNTSANGLTANWITPFANGNGEASAPSNGGTDVFYTYNLVFDNPNGSVTIDWTSDNSATFFLNGALLSSLGETSYGALTTFTILASEFGVLNTFEVIVKNLGYDGPNPTGLLVNASVAPVPLPAALPLLGAGIAGLGAMGWVRRRRERRAARLAI